MRLVENNDYQQKIKVVKIFVDNSMHMINLIREVYNDRRNDIDRLSRDLLKSKMPNIDVNNVRIAHDFDPFSEKDLMSYGLIISSTQKEGSFESQSTLEDNEKIEKQNKTKNDILDQLEAKVVVFLKEITQYFQFD